jgi:hypothetical protein
MSQDTNFAMIKLLQDGESVMNIEEVVADLKTLSIAEQQEVLAVIAREISQRKRPVPRDEISALEAARNVLDFVGEGPSDLSTNPQYMEGYGRS